MPTQEQLEAAMQRALAISLQGPAFGVNPQVGSVILDPDGEIVTEGYHRGAGTDHAEVMALKNFAQDFPDTPLTNHTAVVTLEPCNHTGKTGPCAKALVDAGISSVVFAVSDPGLESGSGAKTLTDAGIEVSTGLMMHQAEDQNRVWLTANRLKRPFVTLKWASTLDGRSAAQDGSSKWISGAESRADTHFRRSEVDAILVGTATVLADDPELTARKPDGGYFEHQPVRIVIGETELPRNLKIFNDQAPTVEIRTRDLNLVLAELWSRELKHVFVEAGSTLASALVAAGLVDEFLVYMAPMLLGGNNSAIGDIGITNMEQALELEILETTRIGKDIFIRARSA